MVTISNELYKHTDQLILIPDNEEPTLYIEARKKMKWIEAMRTELNSIEKTKTWNMVRHPKGRKAIGLMRVFKVKRDLTRRILKHKARSVERGYVQKHGIDYKDWCYEFTKLEMVCVCVCVGF